jgi:2-dehydro-3-deoxygluconokinase
MSKVAVIGECMIELYKSEESYFKQTFGGDSFNCATYLKRSYEKAQVEYITVLGDDELSSKMLDFFHEQNLLTTYVDKLENKNPGLYLISTKDGERSFSYWRGEAAAKDLFLTKSLKKLQKNLPSFDLIYLSAISLAIMSKKGRANLYKILKEARKNGVKVAFDSNYRARLYKNKDEAKSIYNEALSYCDIFLPSYDDEVELWGDISKEKIIKNSIRFGVSEIIISHGEEDIIYYYEQKTNTVKIKKLEKIIDSTSAGDSFNAKYLASRLKGENIEKSIKKANKLASKVIMYQGAIIPKEKNDK